MAVFDNLESKVVPLLPDNHFMLYIGLGERGGGISTPYNGYTGSLHLKWGTFFRLQIYESVGISLVDVYKRVGKCVISVCKKAQRG